VATARGRSRLLGVGRLPAGDGTRSAHAPILRFVSCGARASGTALVNGPRVGRVTVEQLQM
jgi:hypothetical protein